MKTWNDRTPVLDQPESKYVMTVPKRRRKTAVPEPARAIPPVDSAVQTMEDALRLLDKAWRDLDRVGRMKDASDLSTTINNLRYRHIPYAKLTACTNCSGYRDGEPGKMPMVCVHVRDEQ